MSCYTIRIKWDEEVETIFFDSDQKLAKGDVINTSGQWPDGKPPVKYVVKVISHRRRLNSHAIELLYDRASNTGRVLENLAWGRSVLRFDTESLKGTAEWFDIDSGSRRNGVAKARLVREELREDLGLIYVQRQVRKQTKFRKALSKFGEYCALSGDETSSALEAAHLVEVREKGGFSPSNGLLLRADIHKMFDAGVLRIDRDGNASLAPDVQVSNYYLAEVKNWKLDPEQLRRVAKALMQRNDWRAKE